MSNKNKYKYKNKKFTTMADKDMNNNVSEVFDDIENQREQAVEDIDDIIDEIVSDEQTEEDKLSELNRQLADANAAVEKEKKEYMFLLADFDNFRKRVAKEKVELIKNGAEKALTGLLPIVDDFERGLQATKDTEDPGSIREGMDLIYQKFVKYLSDNGVQPIDSAPGADFDTDRHEAIAIVPAPTPELKGKIIDTTQKGYTLNGDKVIRHAKVVVGE